MNHSNDEKRTVEDNTVVSMDYMLKVDGGVVDKSEQDDPIQFIQGKGQIIPGLESRIYGMSVGESRKIVVPPSEGYGESDANAYAEIPRSEFPADIPLETGVALQLRDQDGEVLNAYIVEVRDDTIRLNFNHPLAGKELHFTVTVVDLRSATDEELSHGHVHTSGEDDDDEEDDDWYDEDEDDDEGWEDEDDEDL